MGISLILSSFKRPHLLERGLFSIARQNFPSLEVVVVNDGIEDETENVCASYRDRLDIKYIFSGQRNKDGDKWRVSGFALNIGVKQCKHEWIILSCAEIYHLNDCLKQVENNLAQHHLVTPRFMYFDDEGAYTNNLKIREHVGGLKIDRNSVDGVLMPFFIGMQKGVFMNIGGYDEDFTGYAADDNDLMDRLTTLGMQYCYTDARIVHLFHGKRCDSQVHHDNPAWVYNYNLYKERKDQIIRNKNREWGIIRQK